MRYIMDCTTSRQARKQKRRAVTKASTDKPDGRAAKAKFFDEKTLNSTDTAKKLLKYLLMIRM